MPWIVLILSIVLPLIYSNFMKNKSKANLIIDIIMIFLSIFLFLTSIFKWFLIPADPVFLLGLTNNNWMQLHDLSGMMLSGVVIAHVVLHWNWIIVVFKKSFLKNK